MAFTINMRDSSQSQTHAGPLDLSDDNMPEQKTSDLSRSSSVRETKIIDNRSIKSKKSDKSKRVIDTPIDEEIPQHIPDDNNTYKIKLIETTDPSAGPSAGLTNTAYQSKSRNDDHNDRTPSVNDQSSEGRASPSVKLQGRAVPGIDYEIDIIKKPDLSKSSTSPTIPVHYPSDSHNRSNAENISTVKSESRYIDPQPGNQPTSSSNHRYEETRYVPETVPLNTNTEHRSVGHDMTDTSNTQNVSSEERDRINELPVHELSTEEKQLRMEEALAKLQRLDELGYTTSRVYGYTSKLEEVEKAVKKLSHQRDVDKAVKWQRKILFFSSTVLEYLNEKYNPFTLKLSGWSESIFENLHEYDEVFEELYEKYHESIAMAPEIKLLGMFLGSALMFHFSRVIMQKAKKEMPGFEEVMNRNPELRRAYIEKAKEVAMEHPEHASDTNNKPTGVMGMVSGLMRGMGMDQQSGGRREVKGERKMRDVDGLLGSLEKESNIREESIEL